MQDDLSSPESNLISTIRSYDCPVSRGKKHGELSIMKRVRIGVSTSLMGNIKELEQTLTLHHFQRSTAAENDIHYHLLLPLLQLFQSQILPVLVQAARSLSATCWRTRSFAFRVPYHIHEIGRRASVY